MPDDVPVEEAAKRLRDSFLSMLLPCSVAGLLALGLVYTLTQWGWPLGVRVAILVVMPFFAVGAWWVISRIMPLAIFLQAARTSRAKGKPITVMTRSGAIAYSVVVFVVSFGILLALTRIRL